MKEKKIVAFIPARSGSKRVPNKNIKYLCGHPLIAYTIVSALKSKVFDKVICATDDVYYAEIARYYGAEVPLLRPKNISDDKSSDFEWVEWLLNLLSSSGEHYDAFSILRPTSPFRQPTTIKMAWECFSQKNHFDSLRAIQKVTEHPGKMWILENNLIYPLLPFKNGIIPWHSSQYGALPEIYLQNASLEIAWTKVVKETNSISGNYIMPFISENQEGFDINKPEDWILAKHFIESGEAKLVDINLKPFK